jgi:BRCT domain type II-containing protein
VFTGVLETLSREAAQELVTRYGGKAIDGPSSKASYVVLESRVGPSKLRKTQELGVKMVSEDGFLKLIRELSANGGTEEQSAAKKVRAGTGEGVATGRFAKGILQDIVEKDGIR